MLRLTKLRLRINLRTFQKVEPLKSEKLIARLLSPPEGADGEPLAACSTQSEFVPQSQEEKPTTYSYLPHTCSFEKRGGDNPTPGTWGS